MRVTVCELPHEPAALADAWAALCEHTVQQSSELVLLPELAMMEPVWQEETFDPARWAAAEQISDAWNHRLAELGVPHVVGTRPITIDGRPFNQGFLWSAASGLIPLRRKFYLPDESGSWEARWFDRGDSEFTEYHAGGFSFGLNICTELWAVETYAAYAAHGVQVILSPRATAAATTVRWLSVGVVAAVCSGAFSLSSNRVDPTGARGGVGWIIDPSGTILARTTPTHHSLRWTSTCPPRRRRTTIIPATCSAGDGSPRVWESGSARTSRMRSEGEVLLCDHRCCPSARRSDGRHSVRYRRQG